MSAILLSSFKPESEQTMIRTEQYGTRDNAAMDGMNAHNFCVAFNRLKAKNR
jgi:hypothetical protein